MKAEPPIVLQSAARHGVAEEDGGTSVGDRPRHARPQEVSGGEVMPRSLDDLIAQADDFADEFESYDPDEDDRGEPTLMAIRRAAYRRALIEQELLEKVRGARRAGATWSKIGQELGTSGEAARQRYADKVGA